MITYPHITFYTDNLPDNVGGRANAFVVRIRLKYRDDIGIHAHECEHVRQWWAGVMIGVLAALVLAYLPALAIWSFWWPVALVAGCGLHSVAYLWLPRYRLWAEVRAYRIQAQHYPDDRIRLFAGFIAENYGLKVSVEKVEEAIRG